MKPKLRCVLSLLQNTVVHSSEERYAIISVFHLCGWTQCPFLMEYDITGLVWTFLPHIENGTFLSKLAHPYQSCRDYDCFPLPLFRSKLILISFVSPWGEWWMCNEAAQSTKNTTHNSSTSSAYLLSGFGGHWVNDITTRPELCQSFQAFLEWWDSGMWIQE